jgi:hypothetical protein
MLELRTGATRLCIVATGLLAGGCGSSKQARTDASSTSHGTSIAAASRAKAQATGFAHMVNLVGTDVPQMRLTAPERERKRPTRSAEEVERCAAGTVPERTVLIRSATFRSENGPERGALEPEVEQVRSAVEVMPTAALAVHGNALARSARARLCLKRALARSSEASAPLRRGAISVSSLPSPLPGVPGSFGLRIASTVAATPLGARPGREHVYMDRFAFVVGAAEIKLTATGAPRPVPTATERRLVALLYNRAKAHRL